MTDQVHLWPGAYPVTVTIKPGPPPDPPPSAFKSVTQTAKSNNALDPQPGADQTVVFKLHASGAGTPWDATNGFGEHYTAVCPASMSHTDDSLFKWFAYNPANTGPNKYILIGPLDHVLKAPFVPPITWGGDYIETFWFGYSWPETPKLAHPYTEVKLDALYDWIFAQYPQASRTRVVAQGQSMGGWGCTSYALRRPTKFAAIFATMPRWRCISLPDIAAINSNNPTCPLPAPETGTYQQRMDSVAYVSNPANRLPFISWTIGKADPYSAWQDNLDAVAALKATKRAFVFAWNNGDHSAGMQPEALINATYDRLTMFELGKDVPVLMNSSRDDLLSADSGGINLGYKWRVIAGGWEITNANGPASVDVLPSSNTNQASKHVDIPAANTWVPVTFP